MSIDGRRTKWRRNMPKILIACVGCTNVTDRQTDGRSHIANVQIYVRGASSRLSLRARRGHDPIRPWGGARAVDLPRSFDLERPGVYSAATGDIIQGVAPE